MVSPVTPVSADHPADRERTAVPDHLGSQGTRVRRVVTESLDQRESKETQVFLVSVAPVLLVSQDYQVLREILAPLVLPVALASLVRRERWVSLACLGPLAALGPLAHQVWPSRVPKVTPAPPDPLEEEVPKVLQVLLAPKVPVALSAAEGPKVRREFPEFLDRLVSPERREISDRPDSRVMLAFLVPKG